MTEELKALAGQSEEILSNLTWRDLILFHETFKVGVEDISQLDTATQIKAIAWLFWRAYCKKTQQEMDFETFLDTPIPKDFFQQS